MSDTILDPASLWEATTPMAEHPSLAFNVRVNVAIVGGGVAGVTSAFLLKKLGQTVALLDGDQCGSGQSGRSIGHAIAAPDLCLSVLVDRVGPERARHVWEAGSAALSRIRAIVREERINCQFGWVPAFLHASPHAEAAVRRRDLEREFEIAQRLGIESSFQAALPGLGLPALRFEGQARLNPLAYLRVLVDQLPGAGSYVFEDTHVDSIQGDGPFVLRSDEYRVTADFVIVATHAPVFDDPARSEEVRTPQVHVARTYLVSGSAALASQLPEGLYWGMGEHPHGCLRVDRHEGQTVAVAGGREQFAHEISDPRMMFRALAHRLSERVTSVHPTHGWSGYVVESEDRLPCIGELAPGRFLATGFGENGLTFGTLGGMLAADAAVRRSNPWRDLFSLERFEAPPAAGSARSPIAATAGRRPSHDTSSFAALTNHGVPLAFEDGALPPGCPY